MGKPGPVLYFTIKSVMLSWLYMPGTMELTVSDDGNVKVQSKALVNPLKAYIVELNEETTKSSIKSPVRSVKIAGTKKPDEDLCTVV